MVKNLEQPTEHKTDRANVNVFPPLFGLILVVLGYFLKSMDPLQIFANQRVSTMVGVPIFLAGIAFQIAIIRSLRKANTTPLFTKPSTLVLRKGFYAYSRNPMYMAIFTWYVGLIFIFNSYWFLLVLAVTYLFLRYYVVIREEEYLESKFGDEYREYKSKVPRWI